MHSQFKAWKTYVSPFDPCPPVFVKWYSTPPQLYLGFQPPDLPQFSPFEAFRRGVLWPVLYSPYEGRKAHNEMRDYE
ncbi:spore coat associated protein CotJA [Brevibacillus massiliensis]|uniref:spore coat associated protein CotJA n=1 Tax=Brevibacillus massiliensis TaxID=1118054 RepID=UPI0003128069|nr:spore coat associated protein CotJA [Brevibacillus massiliensis]